MALILQEQGVGRYTWLEWVARVPAFADMPPERIQEVVTWMLAQGMLWEEQCILGIGQKARKPMGGDTSWNCYPFSSPHRCSQFSTDAGNWGSSTN
jgi:hypothetical protein